MPDSQNKLMHKLSEDICTIESDVTHDILTKNPTPSGLDEVTENAAGFAESTTKKHADPSFKIACKAGCNWCCYQPVSISGMEAFRIARFIRSMPNDEQKQLLLRLRKLDQLTRGKSRRKRAKLRLECAFLKEDLCSIYSVRPLACAGFTSADAGDCRDGYRKGFHVNFITHEKSRVVAYKAVQRGVFLGLMRAVPTADASLFELTAAILITFDNPGSELAWLKGEPVFSKARINPSNSLPSGDT